MDQWSMTCLWIFLYFILLPLFCVYYFDGDDALVSNYSLFSQGLFQQERNYHLLLVCSNQLIVYTCTSTSNKLKMKERQTLDYDSFAYVIGENNSPFNIRWMWAKWWWSHPRKFRRRDVKPPFLYIYLTPLCGLLWYLHTFWWAGGFRNQKEQTGLCLVLKIKR